MLLSRRQILAVHGAAIRTGAQRAPLLSGIDPRVIARISSAENPGAQILLDLTELDAIGRPAGTVAPLQIWLDNAGVLAAGRQEVEIFRGAARIVGGEPARPLEAELGLLWSSDPALSELLDTLGIAREELPPGASVEARFHCLLIELMDRRDAPLLSALAAAVRRRAPAEELLAEQIALLAASARSGEWPEDLEEVWLSVRRSGRGWHVEYRLPSLSVRGSLDFEGRAQRQLTPDVSLSAEAARDGLLVQLAGGRGGPLVGATARIWAGLRSFSRTLRPWADDRLGTSTETLLSLFIDTEGADEGLEAR